MTTGVILRKALLLASIALAPCAFAWDGVTTGNVLQIDAATFPSFGQLRVYLSGALCGTGSANWAYVNTTDVNYSLYAATILSAQAQGLQIIVYANKDSNGYCQMGYLSLL